MRISSLILDISYLYLPQTLTATSLNFEKNRVLNHRGFSVLYGSWRELVLGENWSQASTSILDGSLLQNICEEVRRSNSNQDCILQELKLMNRNIETLCQQRQYIFPSPTAVKVPVDINIHKIIESYETSKKEDYVGYDVKKQKMVKNAKQK